MYAYLHAVIKLLKQLEIYSQMLALCREDVQFDDESTKLNLFMTKNIKINE